MIKENFAALKDLHASIEKKTAELEDLNRQYKDLEFKVKSEMEAQDMSKFESPFGTSEIVDREKFYVAAENHDKLIAYFKADANLAPCVKVKEDVAFQTYNAHFKELFKEKNVLPNFVQINTWQELKVKFK